MRSPGGTKAGLPCVVVACTNLRIACFAGPSFHEGSGSVCARACAARASPLARTSTEVNSRRVWRFMGPPEVLGTSLNITGGRPSRPHPPAAATIDHGLLRLTEAEPSRTVAAVRRDRPCCPATYRAQRSEPTRLRDAGRKGVHSMIPGTFEYHSPTTVAEATALLARLGDDAKVLSGGQSLIPLMKLRLAAPKHLVDINGLPGLAHLEETNGVLRIGALTRESDLEDSELIRTRYPLLFDTCKVIADPIVRNLATVGGNLAHGDPANDHPATMLALGAEVVATGTLGERTIPIGSFFTGPFSTA